MLPLHPQPKPDEILSSWMVRLAFANGFPLHTFYDKLLGYKAPIWNRDIDRHPADALLSLLARHSGHAAPALRPLALNHYQGILFESLPVIGNAMWILPVGIFHRIRLRAGMQYCPRCLQQETPYYRCSWRLALTTLCAMHRCVMLEHCPACHSPIAYHRLGMGRSKVISEQALALCHHCRYDLREVSETYPVWPEQASMNRYLTTLAQFETLGWQCDLPASPSSIPFFRGLYLLISLISGRHGYRIRAILESSLGIHLSESNPGPHAEFEHRGTLIRLNLLLATFWLIGDWPTRFLSICETAKTTRSRIYQDASVLPYWLATVIDAHLDRRPYLPSNQEICAAGRYIQAESDDVTPQALGRMLGLHRDSTRAAWRIWQSTH